MSWIAGASPRYGTNWNEVPVIFWNEIPARFPVEPAPGMPTLALPGLALATQSTPADFWPAGCLDTVAPSHSNAAKSGIFEIFAPLGSRLGSPWGASI